MKRYRRMVVFARTNTYLRERQRRNTYYKVLTGVCGNGFKKGTANLHFQRKKLRANRKHRHLDSRRFAAILHLLNVRPVARFRKRFHRPLQQKQ